MLHFCHTNKLHNGKVKVKFQIVLQSVPVCKNHKMSSKCFSHTEIIAKTSYFFSQTKIFNFFFFFNCGSVVYEKIAPILCVSLGTGKSVFPSNEKRGVFGKCHYFCNSIC